ncbi:uncharacterized protein [Diadema setosum]|uniref:uncharacterized protein n=1 Tax=Diadema setosum TaxID=31175 RepID=UPI003B3A8349
MAVLMCVVPILVAILFMVLWRHHKKCECRSSQTLNQPNNRQLQVHPVDTTNQSVSSTDHVELSKTSTMCTDAGAEGHPFPSHYYNTCREVTVHQEDPYHIYQDAAEVYMGTSQAPNLEQVYLCESLFLSNVTCSDYNHAEKMNSKRDSPGSASVYPSQPREKSKMAENAFHSENSGQITPNRQSETIQEQSRWNTRVKDKSTKRNEVITVDPLYSTAIYSVKSREKPEVGENGYLVLEADSGEIAPCQSKTIQVSHSSPDYKPNGRNINLPMRLNDRLYSIAIYSGKSSEKMDEHDYLVPESIAKEITPDQSETIQGPQSCHEYRHASKSEKLTPLPTSLNDRLYSTSIYSGKPSEKLEEDQHGYLILGANAGQISPDQSETHREPHSCPEYTYIDPRILHEK